MTELTEQQQKVLAIRDNVLLAIGEVNPDHSAVLTALQQATGIVLFHFLLSIGQDLSYGTLGSAVTKYSDELRAGVLSALQELIEEENSQN